MTRYLMALLVFTVFLACAAYLFFLALIAVVPVLFHVLDWVTVAQAPTVVPLTPDSVWAMLPRLSFVISMVFPVTVIFRWSEFKRIVDEAFSKDESA